MEFELFLLLFGIAMFCAGFITYHLWSKGILYTVGSLLFLFVLGHLLQRGGL